MTNEHSLTNLLEWKKSFSEFVDTESRVVDFPFVVLGNKADLEGERKISKESAEAWCAENGGLAYFETSGITGQGLENAFLEMANKSLINGKTGQIEMPAPIAEKKVNLQAPVPTKKKQQQGGCKC